MISAPIELYTDGSSLRNPGASGLGYVIRYWDDKGNGTMPEVQIIEGSQGFRLSTNNRMELMAALWGLRTIISNINNGTLYGAKQINLQSDSEYFCKAINQRWIAKWSQNDWMTSGFKGSKPKPVKNKDLWEQIVAIQDQISNMGVTLTVSHIEGHAGHEFNERADKLAVAASNGTSHIIDEVYEKENPQQKNNQNNMSSWQPRN